jgi:hypothetical protein
MTIKMVMYVDGPNINQVGTNNSLKVFTNKLGLFTI